MSQQLRVLQVEDSESDAAIVLRALRKAGYRVEAVRVEAAPEMRAALARESFHVILADYQLPQFDAPGALAVLQESGQDLPFIVVSGMVGEEAAVAMMRCGAHDYLMKDHLARLAPAVERELREAQGRRERRAAEQALRESEERFRTFFLKAPIGIVLTDAGTRLIDVNDTFCRMLGYSRDELLRLTLTEIIHSEDREQLLAAFGAMADGGATGHRVERRYLKKDGSTLWVSVTSAPIRTPDGSLLYVIGMLEDITARRQIEARNAQLVESLRTVNEMAIQLGTARDIVAVRSIIAENLRAITDAVAVTVSSYRPEARELVVERVAVAPDQRGLMSRLVAILGRRLLGFCTPVSEDALRDMVGNAVRRFANVHEVSYGAIPRALSTAMSDGFGLGDVYAMAFADEGQLLETCALAMRRDAPLLSGELQSVLARVCTAALSRVKAAEALRHSEARFSTVFHASPQSIALARLDDGTIVDVNHAWSVLTGWSHEEVLGRTTLDLNVWARAADRERLLGMVREQPVVQEFECQVQARSGAISDVLMSAAQVEIAGESYLLTSAVDVSDRKRTELALRESEERFRGVFRGVTDGILLAEIASGALLMANPAICEMLGASEQELSGLTVKDIHAGEGPDSLSEVLRRQVAGDQRLVRRVVVRRRDGGTRLADINAVPVVLGGRRCLLGVFRDVTAVDELEQRMRQVQKMEAIGQLAGGVAHDFNNILAVILGYSEMLQRRLTMPGSQHSRIVQIHKAAERGASLTRQLLAFSRKQVLAPRVLDLNALVRDMTPMLRRLIGEDVELSVSLDDGLGRVMADESQIHQVLMNLAVNARDAMPRGGLLTIQTAHERLEARPAGPDPEERPGDYVVLAVRDTGSGMDAPTLSRIFEPFFSTKVPGKGTGLGLSTVYGVVKQSGGHIHVESEPGRGATFRVYLPRVEGRVEPAHPEVRIGSLAGRSETILLLEDDAALRSLEQEILEEAGYRVIVAARPEEALAAMSALPDRIDLLLTDVVMPGMSGPEVAAKLLERRPEVKVLYVSGYAADALAGRGVRESERLLDKPFTTATLLREVRATLDAPAPSAPHPEPS